MSQNAQLQTQQSGTESERDVATREKEELRTVYDLLLHDHEKLSALHERQAAEYEDLIGKHGELKSGHKSLELQHRGLEHRCGRHNNHLSSACSVSNWSVCARVCAQVQSAAQAEDRAGAARERTQS